MHVCCTRRPAPSLHDNSTLLLYLPIMIMHAMISHFITSMTLDCRATCCRGIQGQQRNGGQHFRVQQV